VTGIPVASGDTEAIDAAIRSARNCCMVLLETPANPTMTMTDIERAAAAAAAHPDEPPVLVDNTFLGPSFQHPLMLGAQVTLYSATKYLSGNSDMLGGVAITDSSDIIQKIRGVRSMFGNIMQPDECWMLDGRLSTVALRMNRQSKNAQRIAEALNGHQLLSRVIYPTLFTDPEQKRIFEKQCDFPGGMFSIEFKGGKDAAFEFLRHLRIARNAVSLGGVDSLVQHPASLTHRPVAGEAGRVLQALRRRVGDERRCEQRRGGQQENLDVVHFVRRRAKEIRSERVCGVLQSAEAAPRSSQKESGGGF